MENIPNYYIKNDENDSYYEIIKKLYTQSINDIYLVKFKEEINIAKVIEAQKELDDEVRILKLFVNENSIIQYKESGKGELKFQDIDEKVNYIIFEYASKGDLFDYIDSMGGLNFQENNTMNEEFSKYIFYKIVEGIEICHKKGICHRDIKLENIFLGNNFELKIGDFGFATENKENLVDYLGSKYYQPPEIINKQSYNGFKSDIFSLGACLFYLCFDNYGFQNANKEDGLYSLIINKNFDIYWEQVGNYITTPSQKLKNLFQNMIASKPKDRLSIKEVKNDPWLESTRTLISQKGENLKQFEEKLRDEFRRREEIKNKTFRPEIILSSPQSNEGDNRSSNKFGKIKFNKGIKPEEVKEYLIMKYVLTIKGETKLFEPNNFMSNLIDECEENDISTLIRDKGKLQFEARKIEEEDDDIDDKFVVLYHIKVKLYKHGNEYQLCIKELQGIQINIHELVEKIFYYARHCCENK